MFLAQQRALFILHKRYPADLRSAASIWSYELKRTLADKNSFETTLISEIKISTLLDKVCAVEAAEQLGSNRIGRKSLEAEIIVNYDLGKIVAGAADEGGSTYDLTNKFDRGARSKLNR